MPPPACPPACLGAPRCGIPPPPRRPLHSVPFGVLFRDDKCANLFEALMGTLRAAKRRKIIDFDGEMLFQGVHDDVPVSLVG